VSTDGKKFLELLANAIIRKDFIPLRRKDCEGKEKPFFLIADDSSYLQGTGIMLSITAARAFRIKNSNYQIFYYKHLL